MMRNDANTDIGYGRSSPRIDHDVPLYMRFGPPPEADVRQRTFEDAPVQNLGDKMIVKTRDRFKEWDQYASKAVHPDASVFGRMKNAIKTGQVDFELKPFWK